MDSGSCGTVSKPDSCHAYVHTFMYICIFIYGYAFVGIFVYMTSEGRNYVLAHINCLSSFVFQASAFLAKSLLRGRTI